MQSPAPDSPRGRSRPVQARRARAEPGTPEAVAAAPAPASVRGMRDDAEPAPSSPADRGRDPRPLPVP